MKFYLALDGGTTNTRIRLLRDGVLLDTYKLSRGARSGIDDREGLLAAIQSGIRALLDGNAVPDTEVECILVSGMLTSEHGLAPLPHLDAPAGIRELHLGMKTLSLPELSPIPFVLIPGVRTLSSIPEHSDMMRGEETELMGILRPTKGRVAYLLPGSHSKMIFTDEDGRITDFTTFLTGEAIAVLAEHTILKDAVSLACNTVDEDALLRGYEKAHARGLLEAVFKVRLAKNLFGESPVATYSFFLGAILAEEIDRLLADPATTVVIGGRVQIRHALATLLRRLSDKTVHPLTDEEVDASTYRGALAIYEYDA